MQALDRGGSPVLGEDDSSGSPVDNAEALRASLSWLAPLARLAAFVAAAVVLTKSAGESGVDHDLLALLVQLLL